MTETRNQVLGRIERAIEQSSRFIVLPHVRPDGDAVGSILAMRRILELMGKEARAFSQDPVPQTYRFLAGADQICHEVPDPSTFDVAILVDCGEFPRIGEGFCDAVQKIPYLINIDHHIARSTFGDISWVEDTASSTCEMLFELALHLGIRLEPDLSAMLYTGMLADTGSFRYTNTTGRVLEIASQLVNSGANPAEIAQQVYDSGTASGLRLLGKVLSSVLFHCDDRLATAELSLRFFDETGTSPVESEGFINHLRSVKPVQMAIIFRESTDGQVYVSMRSKEPVDVAAFAQRHGGGGHKRAAAFKVKGDLQEVRDRFTRHATDYIR